MATISQTGDFSLFFRRASAAILPSWIFEISKF